MDLKQASNLAASGEQKLQLDYVQWILKPNMSEWLRQRIGYRILRQDCSRFQAARECYKRRNRVRPSAIVTQYKAYSLNKAQKWKACNRAIYNSLIWIYNEALCLSTENSISDC